MGIHEECGVFGVMNKKKEPVAELVYYGLYALQHRGQESCGIVVNDDGVFSSYKDLGLVSEVFSKDTLSHLPEGTIAVGHVRYGICFWFVISPSKYFLKIHYPICRREP